MARGYLNTVLGHLRSLAGVQPAAGLSDGHLLERFALGQDEAAFTALLERHGPMVLGVCRRLLRNPADADDAFQATFLVLVSRAESITRRESVGSWLYGVAYRTAHRAREREDRRRRLERPAVELSDPDDEEPPTVLARRELGPVLDEELRLLPEKYRTPLVLCYLEGRTNAEAAAQLGWPLGTVQVRLFRAREMLRTRLVRRGVTLSAGLFAGAGAADATSTALPVTLAATTQRAAVLFAAGRAATAVPIQVATLTRGVLRTMLLTKLQTVAAVLVVAAVLGVTAGFAAQHMLTGREVAESEQPLAPAAAAPEPANAADALAEPDASPKDAERPRVVQVFPPDGATDVEPVTEIRLRFDRPMDRNSAELVWGPRAPAGFRLRGEMRYAEATREFILPVQLSPGQKHEITANALGSFREKNADSGGFCSTNRLSAKVFRWSFTTARPAAKEGKPPRVTAVDPPADTEVALLTPLEVTFDQPMDPLAYGLGVSEREDVERHPELLGQPVYDAARRRFTLLTRLPANWNGELRLTGFRSQGGVEAAPMTVKYRTLRTVVPESLQKRVEQAGRSAELRQLVERVRKVRRDLTSVSEEAVWCMFSYSDQAPSWYHSLETTGSRFQMQGGQKFLGVIDGIMHMPFRIGSDGTTCWWRWQGERTSLPAKEVAEKNVLFCDAFDAASTADADRIIREQKLEYLGETTVRGRRCYRVRSWAIGFITRDWLSHIRDWYFDAATLLPVRIEMNGDSRIDYIHTRVNQPIPDEEFRPDASPDVRAVPAELLKEGYTLRFLNVNDGSSGRMSVRWGMKGPKGTSSSGLN